MNKTYDCVVIGGGIAGYYAARTLKRGGKSVVIVEKEKLGGVAIVSGALPIKKILDHFKEQDKKSSLDIKEELLENWESDLIHLNNRVNKELQDIGIDIIFGDGEFLDENSYRVDEKILKADYFIIASGTSPKSLDGFEIDGDRIITHKEVIQLEDIPKSVIVLGGNVEGVEIAALYAELGVEVCLIEMEKSILFENDRDLVLAIENHLKQKNVKIITGVGGKRAEYKKDGIAIILEDGREILAEKIVSTVLRSPNFPRRIDRINIKSDSEKIIVDKNLMTGQKNIFAIGDINGILGMAHVAITQALKVSNYILNNKSININYRALPRAIYTLPEMGGVGMQELDLKREGISYKVGTYDFSDTWRGWSKKAKGFVKVLLDKDNIILGIWMVGRDVSEYIGLMGFIIKEKSTADDIIENLIIHPSLSEAILEAVINGKEKVI